MTNQVVQLKLDILSEDHQEVVALEASGNWNSPAGGWLDATRGTWAQTMAPEQALVLTSDGREMGRCLGLVFATVAAPDNGRLHWESKPDGGGWRVFATDPPRQLIALEEPTLAERAAGAVPLAALVRPTFSDLRAAYSTDPASVHPCTMAFPNTCAIRMSEALAKVVPGIVQKFVASGVNLCPHDYVRGAQDLASVLRRSDVFGAYETGFSAPGAAPSTLQG